MVDRPRSKRQRWLHVGLVSLTGVLGSACDLHTKHWATTNLGRGESFSVWEPWVQFHLAYNRGTAFSLIRDVGDGRFALAAVALLFVVGLFWVAWKSTATARVPYVALGLLLGGGVGNLYDRVARQGEGVVDFIRVTLPGGFVWPTFNVADALLVIGAAILLIAGLRERRHPPPEPRPQPG